MKTLSEKLQQQRNKEIEQISAAAIKAGKSNANECDESNDTLDGGTLDEIIVTPDRDRGHKFQLSHFTPMLYWATQALRHSLHTRMGGARKAYPHS